MAQVEPPIAGVTVHFKVWDVDDPFDQIHGPLGADDVPNVDLIDNNQAGPDNRPVPEAPLTQTVTTAPDGTATWLFTVSMQPGNNYRAAATVIDDVFDPPPPDQPQVTQAMADGLSVKTDAAGKFVPNGNDSGYKVPVVWSKMLTVWRKLHVETDSMVRPAFLQNTYAMNWRNPVQDASPDRVIIQVEDGGGFATPTGQFDNCWVRISGQPGKTFGRVFEFQSSAGWDEVVLIVSATNGIGGQKGLAGLGGLTSGIAILSDDDLAGETTFKAAVWGCDDGYAVGGDLQPPDLSALVVRYEPSYILPIQDETASGIGGIATFLQQVNFGSSGNYGKALWDQAKLPTVRQLPIATSAYWTVMVVSAWQAETGKDADPNTEVLTNGINTHDNGATSSSLGTSYTGLCAIFKALMIGESDIPERYTVAHEIAHTLGVPHTSSGLMFPAEPAEGAAQQSQPFSADSLLGLRKYSGP